MNDREAATVNGQPVRMGDVLKQAMAEDGFAALRTQIRAALLEAEAERQGLELTREELQRELDVYRKRHRLYTAADTSAWLQERALSLADLAKLVRPAAYRQKLAAAIPQDQVEAGFHRYRSEYDRVQLSRIDVRERGVARELRFRLEEGADFHTLAREYAMDDESSLCGGYIGWVGRGQLAPALEAAAFGLGEGEIAGPLELRDAYTLIRVEQVRMARLDEAMERAIRDRLVLERLEHSEETADIRLKLWEPSGVDGSAGR